MLADARGAGARGRADLAAAREASTLQLDRAVAVHRRLSPRDDARGAGSPEEADPPVIDLAHLRGFTEGDPQLEQELGALFLSTANLYLERMSEALATGADWSSTAHALKGASANLGAQRLAGLAATAERAAPDPETLAALRHAIDEVRAFFAPNRGC